MQIFCHTYLLYIYPVAVSLSHGNNDASVGQVRCAIHKLFEDADYSRKKW